MRQYFALIHKDSHSDFGVSFPDFPGCVSAASNLEEAYTMGAEALAFHIEGMAEDGDVLPDPLSLDAIMADRANRDGVAILVAAPVSVANSKQVDVTLPVDILTEIDAFVAANGFTRSGFLAAAAKKAMAS